MFAFEAWAQLHPARKTDVCVPAKKTDLYSEPWENCAELRRCGQTDVFVLLTREIAPETEFCETDPFPD